MRGGGRGRGEGGGEGDEEKEKQSRRKQIDRRAPHHIAQDSTAQHLQPPLLGQAARVIMETAGQATIDRVVAAGALARSVILAAPGRRAAVRDVVALVLASRRRADPARVADALSVGRVALAVAAALFRRARDLARRSRVALVALALGISALLHDALSVARARLVVVALALVSKPAVGAGANRLVRVRRRVARAVRPALPRSALKVAKKTDVAVSVAVAGPVGVALRGRGG